MKVELAIFELEQSVRKRQNWMDGDDANNKHIQHQIDQLRTVIRLLRLIQFGG